MLVEYTINVFSRSTALVRRLGPIPIRRWRLSLLQLLSLLFVLLLQLLRLLLVLLLHLLLCRFTGVLLRQPLMFLLLLLLEFLPFLFLLREYLFLLLLVFLVQLRVACVWSAGARRERTHCCAADFRPDWPRDWQEEYKAPLALLPARRRGRSMLLV